MKIDWKRAPDREIARYLTITVNGKRLVGEAFLAVDDIEGWVETSRECLSPGIHASGITIWTDRSEDPPRITRGAVHLQLSRFAPEEVVRAYLTRRKREMRNRREEHEADKARERPATPGHSGQVAGRSRETDKLPRG